MIFESFLSQEVINGAIKLLEMISGNERTAAASGKTSDPPEGND
jgi:hypothetical protein